MELALSLSDLKSISTSDKVIDRRQYMETARENLYEFFLTDFLKPVSKSSQESGEKLITVLSNYVEAFDAELGERTFTADEVRRFKAILYSFEEVLKSTLSAADVYFAQQVGGFDSSILIESGLELMPLGFEKHFSEAIDDLHDATRCLAFELPTSAGIHLMRVLESALRKYFEQLTPEGKIKSPENKAIGQYLQIMESHKATFDSDNINFLLDSVRKLYRNPLMHPDERLSMDTAIGLLGLVRSILAEMIAHIETKTSSD